MLLASDVATVTFSLGVINILIIIVAVATICVPIIILTCKILGINIRIGRFITINSGVKRRAKPEETDPGGLQAANAEAGSVKTGTNVKAHKDCHLYTDIPKIIELTDQHIKVICSIDYQDRMEDQMIYLEKSMDMLFHEWSIELTKVLDKFHIKRNDSLYDDLFICLENVKCTTNILVKNKIKLVLSREDLSISNSPTWDKARDSHTTLLVAEIMDVFQNSIPQAVLSDFANHTEKPEHMNAFILDLGNYQIKESMRLVFSDILDYIKDITVKYSELKDAKHTEYLNRVRKIVACEYSKDDELKKIVLGK